MSNLIEHSIGNLTEKDIFLLISLISAKYGTEPNPHGPLKNAILELVYELSWKEIMIFLAKAPNTEKDTWEGYLQLILSMIKPNVCSFKTYAITVIFTPQQ